MKLVVKIAGMLTLAIMSISAFGQFEIHPAYRPAPKALTKSNTAGRMKAVHPLILPFWDDFSDPDGIHADTMKWFNSPHVWVTDGIAIDPPTIKAATLDGLNSQGATY